MLIKTTKSLFRGIYQYKIVLKCAGAAYFRSGDMNNTLAELSKVDVISQNVKRRYGIKTQEDLAYALLLQKSLKKLSDIEVRVESPFVTVYSNSRAEIDTLANLDKDNVKYISVPPAAHSLTEGTIILPKVPYEFRVTLGKTTHNNEAFVSWADNNPKLKLTNSCRRDLCKDRSWGGTYFYISGDNNLLMAKMHLGGSINKVERIIKA